MKHTAYYGRASHAATARAPAQHRVSESYPRPAATGKRPYGCCTCCCAATLAASAASSSSRAGAASTSTCWINHYREIRVRVCRLPVVGGTNPQAAGRSLHQQAVWPVVQPRAAAAGAGAVWPRAADQHAGDNRRLRAQPRAGGGRGALEALRHCWSTAAIGAAANLRPRLSTARRWRAACTSAAALRRRRSRTACTWETWWPAAPRWRATWCGR